MLHGPFEQRPGRLNNVLGTGHDGGIGRGCLGRLFQGQDLEEHRVAVGMVAQDHVVLGQLIEKPPGADHLHDREEMADYLDDGFHLSDFLGNAFGIVRRHGASRRATISCSLRVSGSVGVSGMVGPLRVGPCSDRWLAGSVCDQRGRVPPFSIGG